VIGIDAQLALRPITGGLVMAQAADAPLYYNISELARTLGFSRSFISEVIRDHPEIPHVAIPSPRSGRVVRRWDIRGVPEVLRGGGVVSHPCNLNEYAVAPTHHHRKAVDSTSRQAERDSLE
jgi:hypothetical protein